MEKSNKRKQILILIACCLAILLFNTLVFPRILSWGTEQFGTISQVTEPSFMPAVSESGNKSQMAETNLNNNIEWLDFTSMVDLSSTIVKRISDIEETNIDINSLDPKVAENLLSVEQIMDHLKQRVSNLLETNHLAYTIQLVKSEVPGIPYKYNIILGKPEEVKKVYKDSQPFASYYEPARIVVPLKGNISLGRINYLQVNAFTCDILVQICQGTYDK